MSISACAQIVASRDPDRFAAVMSAPIEAREKLFPILAFNLEIAKAPWVTKEAMIAEMRLQFWHDVIDGVSAGKDPKAHEVASPLAALMKATNLPAERFHAMISARRWDIYSDPHDDAKAFNRYLQDTGGQMLALSAIVLENNKNIPYDLVQYGADQALAGYFQAVPALENAQKRPLVDGRPTAIQRLAKEALERMNAFELAKHSVPAPALRLNWMAKPILRRVANMPELVAHDALDVSEFKKKTRLLWLAFRNRY